MTIEVHVQMDVSVGSNTVNIGLDVDSFFKTDYRLLSTTKVEANLTTVVTKSIATLVLPELWTSSKIIYVKIRDEAGKRSGYFLGSDAFIINAKPANEETGTLTAFARSLYRCLNDGKFDVSVYHLHNAAYGIFPYSLESDGTLEIKGKFGTGITGEINGTYIIEVYALDWPGNVSPFA